MTERMPLRSNWLKIEKSPPKGLMLSDFSFFFAEKFRDMKKFTFALMLATLVLLGGCKKEGSGNGDERIYPSAPTDWATVVEAYPFLAEFPVFDGEVENTKYVEFHGMETVTFFDYKCEESVATTYYAKFEPAGFTKSAGEGSQIYRKTVGDKDYAFSGSYDGGSFALNFSVDTDK